VRSRQVTEVAERCLRVENKKFKLALAERTVHQPANSASPDSTARIIEAEPQPSA
jgi:hypothetical protein